MAEVITTAAELDAVLAVAGEMAEPVVVREGFRVWILTEDEDGRWWAWSWREDDEEGLGRRVESLRLPLAILHPRPNAPAPSDEDRETLACIVFGGLRHRRGHTHAGVAELIADEILAWRNLAARSPQPAKVHNHGPEDGPGLGCHELRLTDGRLIGMCLVPEPTHSRMTQTAPSVSAEQAKAVAFLRDALGDGPYAHIGGWTHALPAAARDAIKTLIGVTP